MRPDSSSVEGSSSFSAGGRRFETWPGAPFPNKFASFDCRISSRRMVGEKSDRRRKGVMVDGSPPRDSSIRKIAQHFRVFQKRTSRVRMAARAILTRDHWSHMPRIMSPRNAVTRRTEPHSRDSCRRSRRPVIQEAIAATARVLTSARTGHAVGVGRTIAYGRKGRDRSTP